RLFLVATVRNRDLVTWKRTTATTRPILAVANNVAAAPVLRRVWLALVLFARLALGTGLNLGAAGCFSLRHGDGEQSRCGETDAHAAGGAGTDEARESSEPASIHWARPFRLIRVSTGRHAPSA